MFIIASHSRAYTFLVLGLVLNQLAIWSVVYYMVAGIRPALYASTARAEMYSLGHLSEIECSKEPLGSLLLS